MWMCLKSDKKREQKRLIKERKKIASSNEGEKQTVSASQT